MNESQGSEGPEKWHLASSPVPYTLIHLKPATATTFRGHLLPTLLAQPHPHQLAQGGPW